MSATPYPITVSARLDPDVSRGLWLVKWLLAIPHYVVLIVLWLAFAVLSVVAFYAILVTGRYPRRIFDFNVGVMRWTWRVTYYAYGALGTDRYPPFTLAEVPDYPAHLEVVHPERLSRGLVLVKWWLLALPHYLVVAFFVGGGLLAADAAKESPGVLWGGGLIGILVLVAAVTLLVTGRYPQAVFDLVLGLQRWVIRVAGYAALMTDVYPPFRLDQGGDDDAPSPEDGAPPPAPPRRGSAAPVVGGIALALAALLGIASAALLATERSLPHEDGFAMTPEVTYGSSGYAVTAGAADLDGADRPMMGDSSDDMMGEARMTATSTDGEEVFVGVGRSDEVAAYLAGVARSEVVAVEVRDGEGEPTYVERGGGPPAAAPGEVDIWTRSDAGEGQRTISFPVVEERWTVVVMRADGTSGVSVDVGAGARLPWFGWFLAAMFLATAALTLVGTALLAPLVDRPAGRPRPGGLAEPSPDEGRVPEPV